MKKFAIALSILLVAGLGVWFFLFRKSPPPTRFVLVVSDTLRADHLGCYGHEAASTPNIDRLAGQSLRFENAFGAASWTFPSNCALLAGKYAYTVADKETPCIVDEAVTLAEHFREAGYLTAGYSSHPIIDPKWKFDQGFETFLRRKPWGQDDRTIDDAIKWLNEHPDDKIFLLVYLFDPHEPYDPAKPPAQLQSIWPQTRSIIRDGKVPMGGNDHRPTFVEHPSNSTECTREEVEILHQLYIADIGDVDKRVGRLLDEVLADDRTVIAFLSDHGEEWLEHGGLRHKELPYKEIVNVPFILRIPGRPAAVVKTPVSNLDLMPTFLELAGIKPQDELHGESLVATDNLSPTRPLLCESLHCDELNDEVRIDAWAVRSGDRSVIHIESGWPDDPPVPEGGLWEYFDLAQDPTQQKPLSVAENAADLQEILLDFEERSKSVVIETEAAPDDNKHGMDEELRRELEALGYIGGD